MDSRPVEERDVTETLDAVDRSWAVRVEAEAEMFELAAHFADLNPPQSARHRVGPDGGAVPGSERGVRVGGPGTPRVAEFAAAELGARMRLGSWAARAYLADALDTRHRLPALWQLVRARQARIPLVRLVAAKTRHLSIAAAGEVGEAMPPVVDGSLPWSRFEGRLDGKIVAADPALAAEREQERARAQFARRTRSSEGGMAGFYLHSTVGVIARLDATVGYVAEALAAFGDSDDLATRRVKAMLVLANPTRAVELLAAYTALRARSLDIPLSLPLDETNDQPMEEPTAQPAPTSSDDRACRDHSGSGLDKAKAEPADEPEPDDAEDDQATDPPVHPPADALAGMDAFARRVGFDPTRLPHWLTVRGRADDAPRFGFDWSSLLPPLTLNLHLSLEDFATWRFPDPHHPGAPPCDTTGPPTGPSDGPPGHDPGGGGVVRWEGEGPITHAFVHRHLRPLNAYTIVPLVDPSGMAPVDAYELPDRHRRAVRLRTPAEASPWSGNLTDTVDADHVEAYVPADASTLEKDWSTRLDNIIPLGRFAHRIKTHGRWTVKQPFDGIVLWRDPHGQIYLVDHTGTHKITAPSTTAGAPAARNLEIEIYPSDVILYPDGHFGDDLGDTAG